MNTAKIKTVFACIVFLVAIWLLLLGGCSLTGTTGLQTGTLQGKVSIGPLQPVEQAGQPLPTPPPEIYASRQVVVFSPDGQKEFARQSISPDGSYQVALPPGQYQVDINHQGIDSAKGLPALVEIKPGEVTQLDIQIDTGIR